MLMRSCNRKTVYISLIMCFLVCLLVIILISKITQPGECLVRQAVFRRNEKKYLANHVFETRQAETELECGMQCVGHGSCASVNYKTSGNGKGLCELNSKTLREISDVDRSMHNPEFNHLYIIKTVREIFRYWCSNNIMHDTE